MSLRNLAAGVTEEGLEEQFEEPDQVSRTQRPGLVGCSSAVLLWVKKTQGLACRPGLWV